MRGGRSVSVVVWGWFVPNSVIQKWNKSYTRRNARPCLHREIQGWRTSRLLPGSTVKPHFFAVPLFLLPILLAFLNARLFWTSGMRYRRERESKRDDAHAYTNIKRVCGEGEEAEGGVSSRFDFRGTPKGLGRKGSVRCCCCHFSVFFVVFVFVMSPLPLLPGSANTHNGAVLDLPQVRPLRHDLKGATRDVGDMQRAPRRGGRSFDGALQKRQRN